MTTDAVPSRTPTTAAEEFVGCQIWKDPDGVHRVTLFRAGQMVKLTPSGELLSEPPGFYNLEDQPVPAP